MPPTLPNFFDTAILTTPLRSLQLYGGGEAMRNAAPSYVRIDFVSEVLAADEETHTVRMAFRPDPRRYELFERDGKTWWRDKYFDYIFDLDSLAAAHAQRGDIPLYYLTPEIKDPVKYADGRIAALRRQLTGLPYEPPAETAIPHRPLPEDAREFPATFISLDIVNSTKMQTRYGRRYEDLLEPLITELGTVVGQFHGTILKLTGDGLISFLDHPSINSQCDTSVDLGLMLLNAVALVNTATSKRHPKIQVRIGAEHGIARTKLFTVPATGYRQADITSDALNRAAKIQQKAPANSLVIGQALYERIHVQWLERATETNIRVNLDRHYKTYLVR